MISEKSNSISSSQSYPYMHATFDDRNDRAIINEVYGSPKNMSESRQDYTEVQTEKGNNIRFCAQCGRQYDSSIDSNLYCTCCGSSLRFDESIIVTNCVYASPEMMKGNLSANVESIFPRDL